MSVVLNLEIVKPPPKWRTLLTLGRVSNLPTVWSNCVAGWWLGGGGRRGGLVMALVSISFLYIGGMFLNDAFDADFDRHHRRLRPIPSGAISEAEVWRWGAIWMLAGVVGLVWMGWTTAILALVLAACILVYDAAHKDIAMGPLLMGFCRFFVYLTAAAAGGGLETGAVIWPAAALGLYVTGLSGLARKESGTGRPSIWPALLLAAPLALGFAIDNDARWAKATSLGTLLAAWVVWALAQTYWRAHPRVGATVSRLLAGVALVDWLAVAPGENGYWWVFLLFFAAALLSQRFIPAT